MEANLIDLPDFKADSKDIPTVRLKSIRFENFKRFSDYYIDFSDRLECDNFSCFFGPNGSGKSTILNSIQMIFSRYEGYEDQRLRAYLGKSIRQIDGVQKTLDGETNFLITACIESSLGNYEVQINKDGFIGDHPEEIKWVIYRLCFYTRYDQELSGFQLPRGKWNIFKDLFESVTGMAVEESQSPFDDSDDPRQDDLLKKYVLSFLVHKKNETISFRDCSDGEKKVIKSFSTLLTKEYMPQIILVDNIAMHVESDRHLDLIKAMRRSFPNSQIFSTTHSYQIIKYFPYREAMYDLRFVDGNELFKREPFRQCLVDELKEIISKLKSLTNMKNFQEAINLDIDKAQQLIEKCYNKEGNCFELFSVTEELMKGSSHYFMTNLRAYYEK